MKRNVIFLFLLLLPMFCFSQQNLPRKIIGAIPGVSSTKLYQIQVGAYRIKENAEDTFLTLKSGGLNPVYQEYLDYTRVLLNGITANQMISYLEKIKQLGFDEVIIREDPEIVIKELIVEPKSAPEPEPEPEPEVVIQEPPPLQRDIFCRTWRIVKSDKAEYIGYFMIFTDDGTFLITDNKGESSVAKWRWYGGEYNAFEYSHDNWRNYGRVRIRQLDENKLIFNDPGYNILFDRGYSTIGNDVMYELVPIEDNSGFSETVERNRNE